jgi:hypothetical protein
MDGICGLLFPEPIFCSHIRLEKVTEIYRGQPADDPEHPFALGSFKYSISICSLFEYCGDLEIDKSDSLGRVDGA